MRIIIMIISDIIKYGNRSGKLNYNEASVATELQYVLNKYGRKNTVTYAREFPKTQNNFLTEKALDVYFLISPYRSDPVV